MGLCLKRCDCISASLHTNVCWCLACIITLQMMREREMAMGDSSTKNGKLTPGSTSSRVAKTPLSQRKPSAAERIGVGRPR
jgi:hypothetical protein